MIDVDEILEKLKEKADPGNVAGMARFGMEGHNRLGVRVPNMRRLAKDVGKDHELALELWKTGIEEARIMAALVAEPELVTEEQMQDWVLDLDSWDVCDQLCMNLFDKTPLAWKKVRDWSEREEEFVKRCAFSLLACLASHDREAGDERFIEFFPVLMKGATDERNFVKKAVSWAIRHIGKRNMELNEAALAFSRELLKKDSKAARWIARDAIRELESEKVRDRIGRKKAFGRNRKK